MCFIDICNSSYFALLCKSLLTITIAILITEMNCVFTDHDYFSCYKNDVSLCFLESRIIAVSASVFCWLYPTINKVYLILSYLILSYLKPVVVGSLMNMCVTLTQWLKDCQLSTFIQPFGKQSVNKTNLFNVLYKAISVKLKTIVYMI